MAEKLEASKLPKKERKKFYQDLQREEAQKLELKRKLTKYGGIGLVTALVLLGGFFSAKELSKPLPSMGEVIAVQGREHIAVGAEHPPYNSNPPTSGPHYAQAAEWGVYDKELPDEQLIHNLEHGGVWISFKPTLDKEIIEKLKNLANGYRSKVVFTPREKNDANIVLASWGRLYKMETFDEKQIKDFIEFFKNTGPERVPD